MGEDGGSGAKPPAPSFLFPHNCAKTFSRPLWVKGFHNPLGFLLEPRHVNQVPLCLSIKKVVAYGIALAHLISALNQEREENIDHRETAIASIPRAVNNHFHNAGRSSHFADHQ